MKHLPIVSLALAAAAAAGCGSLDTHTDTPPTLATVQGSVINPSHLPVAGSVRAAIVWRTMVPDQFHIAQDVPVKAVFPASFTFDLDGPPPPEAMLTAQSQSPPPDASSFSTGSAGGAGPGASNAGGSGGGVVMQSLRPLDNGATPFEIAIGTVVAYVDTNGNGMLDLVADDAGAYIDQVLATNIDTSIFYLQGSIPPDVLSKAKNAPADGYSLFYDPCAEPSPQAVTTAPQSWSGLPPNPACPQFADAGPPERGDVLVKACPEPEWEPIGTPFVLTVATAPEISEVACLNGGPSAQPSTSSGSGSGPPRDACLGHSARAALDRGGRAPVREVRVLPPAPVQGHPA